MSYLVPLAPPANARTSDYASGGIFGVVEGANVRNYTVDDLFQASVPAGLGTSLLTAPVTLSGRFMGAHITAGSASRISVASGRTHDVGPRWAQQNPSPGVYVDAGLRALLLALKARGAETVVTIYGTPTWASARPGEGSDPYGTPGGLAEPANMADLASHITRLMNACGDLIDYIEGSNEPKLSASLPSSFSSASATKLAEMYRTIWLAAKAVKPSVKIIGPGCTGINFTNGQAAGTTNSGIDITNYFLSASDGNGGFGKNWIDVLSIHTYTGSNKLSDLIVVKSLITTLKANNSIAAMPVWCTEFGFTNPEFMAYTGSTEARMKCLIRYFMYHVAIGCERAFWYSYGQTTMGWQSSAAMDVEWNRWASIINGATVTSITSAGVDGQLACVINGQNYLI